jgi:hypothetical protein
VDLLAVAIPVTVLMMETVGTFAFIQSQKNREAAWKAREEAGADKA